MCYLYRLRQLSFSPPHPPSNRLTCSISNHSWRLHLSQKTCTMRCRHWIHYARDIPMMMCLNVPLYSETPRVESQSRLLAHHPQTRLSVASIVLVLPSTFLIVQFLPHFYSLSLSPTTHALYTHHAPHLRAPPSPGERCGRRSKDPRLDA